MKKTSRAIVKICIYSNFYRNFALVVYFRIFGWINFIFLFYFRVPKIYKKNLFLGSFNIEDTQSRCC